MSVQIKGLKKSFGNKVIFDAFDFSFPQSGLFALVGPSGKGKTTLLRMISGLDQSYAGTIQRSGTVAFVFQEYRLFPTLTALENITEILFAKPTQDQISDAKRLLLDLGFTEDEMQLKPHELSGGMKQRISLARAFLSDADILLLDEPTKELDPLLAKKIESMLQSISKTRLVIFTIHDPQKAEILGARVIPID